MQALNSIGGEFWMENNDLLSDISFLSSLTTVGVEMGIIYNNSLTSLFGLNNINPESIYNLTIKHNPQLSDCSVESICEYLVDPQGSVEILDNAPFCNTRQQVEDACLVFVEEVEIEKKIRCIPNPLKTTGVINYFLEKNSWVTLNIVDINGRQILRLVDGFKRQGEHRAIILSSGLLPGVYFCVLKTNPASAGQTTKIIKL